MEENKYSFENLQNDYKKHYNNFVRGKAIRSDIKRTLDKGYNGIRDGDIPLGAMNILFRLRKLLEKLLNYNK